MTAIQLRPSARHANLAEELVRGVSLEGVRRINVVGGPGRPAHGESLQLDSLDPGSPLDFTSGYSPPRVVFPPLRCCMSPFEESGADRVTQSWVQLTVELVDLARTVLPP